MKKHYIKSVFLFLVILLVMVSITTLSATDNNITSQTNTQDKITHDTIQTTDHTSNIIKEETKTIEKNNKLNTISTNKTKTIHKNTTTTTTKSADEEEKKDTTLEWNSKPEVTRINTNDYYYVNLYGENNGLANQNVIFKFNGIENPTTDNGDGMYYSQYIPTEFGTLEVKVTFPGTEEYNSASLTETFEVRKPLPYFSAVLSKPRIQLGETTILEGSLQAYGDASYFSGKTVTINFDENNYTRTLNEDGAFSIELSPREVGDYTITTTSEGDEIYDNASIDSYLTVISEKVAHLTVQDEYGYVNLGENVTITGRLYDNENIGIPNKKILIHYEDDTFEVTTNNNGDFSYNISCNTVGAKNVLVTFNGQGEYSYQDYSVNFEVVKQSDTKLTIDKITGPNGDTISVYESIIVEGTLTDSENNPISGASIYIGDNGGVADENGKYSISYYLNEIGTVNITAVFDGNQDYKKTNATKQIMVKSTPIITVNSIDEAQVGSKVSISGKLVDMNNNPVKNGVIKIVINDETFLTSTDGEGTYSYGYDALYGGVYDVYVSSEETEWFSPSWASTQLNVVDSRTTVNLYLDYIGTQTLGDTVQITGLIGDEMYLPIGVESVILQINGVNNTVNVDEYGYFRYNFTPEEIGTYNVSIIYDGNETYQSKKEIATFEVIKEKVTNLIVEADYYVNLGESGIIKGYLCDKNNEKIPNQKFIIFYGDESKNITSDDNGEFSYEIPFNSLGNKEVIVTYEGNDKYTSASQNVWFEVVEQRDSKLTIDSITGSNDDTISVGDTIIVEGTLTDSEGNPVSGVNVYVGVDNDYTDGNGKYTIYYNVYEAGTVNITAVFKGNQNYKKTNATKQIMVKSYPILTVNPIDDVQVGSKVDISGKLVDRDKNPISGMVITIKLNDEVFSTSTDGEGIYSYEYDALYGGVYDVYVSSEETEEFYSTGDSIQFNVIDSRAEVIMYLNYIGTQTLGDTVQITGAIYDENSLPIGVESVILQINGVNNTVNVDEYGYFRYNFTPEEIGTYNVSIIYDGNETYQSKKEIATFEVIKEKVTNLIAEAEYSYVNLGESGIIKGYLCDNHDERIPNQKFIIFYGDESKNITSDDNGEFSYEIPFNSLGFQDVIVTYEGNDEYVSASQSVWFEVVEQRDSKLTIDSITGSNGDIISVGDTIIVEGTLTDSEGNPITEDFVYVGTNYAFTDGNGKYAVYCNVYETGTVDITAVFKGNQEYKKTNATKSIEVNKVDRNIEFDWMESVDVGTKINITGSFISNATLTIKVNNKTVGTVVTDEGGFFSIEYNPVCGGENNLTAEFEGNEYYNPTTTKSTFYVNKKGTTISLNSIDNVNVGTKVIISGKLVDSENNPLNDFIINIHVSSEEFLTSTNEEGLYSIEYETKLGDMNYVWVTSQETDIYRSAESYCEFEVNDTRKLVNIYLNQVDTQILGDTVKLEGYIVDENSNSFTDKIILNIEDTNVTVNVDENGKFTYDYTPTKVGYCFVKAIFEGNEEYRYNVYPISFEVIKEKIAHLTVNTNAYFIDFGKSGVVTGSLTDKNNQGIGNQKINISYEDKTIEVFTNESGKFYYEIPFDTLGSKDVTITYDGYGVYTNQSEWVSFNVVERKNTILNIESVTSDKETIVYGDVIYVKGRLTDSEGNPVESASVYVQNGNWGGVENGYFIIEDVARDVGTVELMVLFEGDSAYLPSNNTITFEVVKSDNCDYKVYVIPLVKVGDKQNILIEGKNTTCVLKINNKTITTLNLENGVCEYEYTTTEDDLGINNLTVEFAESDYYYQTNITKQFTVTNTVIEVDEIPSVYLGEEVTITGKLSNNNNVSIPNAKLNLEILGEKFTTVTDTEGHFSIVYKPILADEYGLSGRISYEGDENNAPAWKDLLITVSSAAKTTIMNLVETAENYIVDDTLKISGNLYWHFEGWTDEGYYDEYNVPIGPTNITIQFDNTNYTVPVDAEGAFEHSIKLDKSGEFMVRIYYKGNETYQPCLEYYSIKVTKKDTQVTIDPIDARVGQSVDITANVKDKDQNVVNEGTVLFKVNDVTIKDDEGNDLYVPVKNGIATTKYTIPESWFNRINVLEAVFVESNKYYSSNNNTSNINILPKVRNTKITIDPISATVTGNTVIISGKLTDEDNKVIANAKLNVLVNGNSYNVTTNDDGVYTHNYLTTTAGINNITVSYPGNNDYTASNNTIKFTVNKKDTKVTVNNINTVSYGDNIIISGKLTDVDNNAIADTIVNLILNNKENSVQTDSNGIFTFNTKATQIGNNNVIVNYPGSTVYNSNKTSATFKVVAKDTKVTINPINTVTLTDTVNITGTLKTVDNTIITNTELTININNNKYTTKTNNQGIFTISYKTTTTGTNNVQATFAGNDYYTTSNDKTTFNVNKLPTKITVNNINTASYDDNIVITGKLTDRDNNLITNAEIKLVLNNKENTILTDNNGVYTFNTKATQLGNNNVQVNYPGSTVYNSNNTSTTFKVVTKDTKVTINPINTVTLTDTLSISGTLKTIDNTLLTNTEITINVNNNKYTTKTDNKGTFKLSYKTDTTGTNNVQATFAGNNYYNTSNAKTTFNVNNLDTTITVNKIGDSLVHDDIVVTGLLKDAKGKLIKDAQVTITLNKDKVNVATDTNGVYSHAFKADTVGLNNVSVVYTGNRSYTGSDAKTTFNVNKLGTTVTVNKINEAHVEEDVVVTGLLKDAKGNVIPDAQVTINCNADNVSTSTNKNGVYSYSIKPTSVGLNNVSVVYTGNRSYTGSDAKTTFNANKLATTIKVNPVNGIIGEDITLTAHITDINGKAVTGGNLVFKLNGKTLRTDGRFDSKQTAWKFKVENGQVTVTIKADLYLRNTKNLTASYSGSYKYEEAKSEIVTAQIKKRNAKLSLTLSPKTQKQYKTITFTAKLTDITSNHKNKTAIYTNTKILFKINGVSLKNKNGKNILVKVNEKGTAVYKYTVPGSMGGITKDGKTRNYNVTAILVSDTFYPDTKDSQYFNVERSPITINITKVTVKNNKLNVQASIRDYKNKKLVGNNVVSLKINGKTYLNPKTNKTQTFTVTNGTVNIKNLQVSKNITIKKLMVVTGARQAYLGGRNETTKIVKV